MPRIYHTPDPITLRNALISTYCMSFSENLFKERCVGTEIRTIFANRESNKQIERIIRQVSSMTNYNEIVVDVLRGLQQQKKNDEKNTAMQWFNTDIATVDSEHNAEETCRRILCKAMDMADDVLPHRIDDFFDGVNVDKNFDLLKYVSMECFINIDHFLHSCLPEKEKCFTNVSVFYDELLKQKVNDKQSGYFLDQYRAACNNYWLRRDFNLKEVNDKSKDPLRTNTSVTTEMHSILGLLVYYINKNPLHKHFPNKGKTKNTDKEEKTAAQKKQEPTKKYSRDRYNNEATYSKIRMQPIETYFFDCIYGDLIEEKDSKFDFKGSDKTAYLNGMYYLDQIYDFKNLTYLAKRLEEFEYTFEGNRFKESDLLELMYQTVLIPDVFSAEYYIDVIFKVLSEEKDADCTYKTCRDNKGVLAFIGNQNRSYKDIQNANLEKCREYILYLSKVYLPVVSSCFYVLFMNEIKSLSEAASVLKNVIRTDVGNYYSEYLNYTRPMFDELKGYVKNNLEKIYTLVAEKIYSDEERFDAICKDFELLLKYPKELKVKLLDDLIQCSIVADRNDISDPLKKETAYSVTNVLDLYVTFETTEDAMNRSLRIRKQQTDRQNEIKRKTEELSNEWQMSKAKRTAGRKKEAAERSKTKAKQETLI